MTWSKVALGLEKEPGFGEENASGDMMPVLLSLSRALLLEMIPMNVIYEKITHSFSPVIC